MRESDWQRALELLERARRLRSDPAPRSASDLAACLNALSASSGDPLFGGVYAPLIAAVAAGPLTIGQAGQSLDGLIAADSGHSHYVNGDVSLDHLHRLRALVDAVVVGAGTVEADDPQLTVRRVAGRAPARVVIDPRRRLSRRHRLFDGQAPTLVVSAAGAGTPGPEDIALPEKDRALPPRGILEALHGRGLFAVLVEGGAATLSAFVRDRLIDRLHVIVAPLILGSGRPAFRLPPTQRIDDGFRVTAGVYSLGDDVLFDCRLSPAPQDQMARMST